MLAFLHIPKTGGCARRSALRLELSKGTVLYRHHERTAVNEAGSGHTPILYLRDPFTKFVSAWDAFQDVIRGTMVGQGVEYDTIDDFVAGLDLALRECGDTCRLIFRPQTWWDNPYDEKVVRLQMETMDTSFPQLLEAQGLCGNLPSRTSPWPFKDEVLYTPMSNTYQGVKSELNEASRASIRERYAADFALWQAAEGEYHAPC